VIDARVLRVQALTALGDIAGAVHVLGSIIRCSGLPHCAGVPVPGMGADGTPGAGASTGASVGAVAGAGASASTSTPVGSACKELGALPVFHNHLPPTHALNRAALAWVANPFANVLEQHTAGVQPALAAAVGPIVTARVALARADLLTRVVAAPFFCSGDLPGDAWGDGEYVAGDTAARLAAVASEAKACEAGVPPATLAWGGPTAADVSKAALEVRFLRRVRVTVPCVCLAVRSCCFPSQASTQSVCPASTLPLFPIPPPPPTPTPTHHRYL
jgi:hypothetical protein